MMGSIDLQGITYPCVVTRKHIKNLNMRVRQGTILISVPFLTSQSAIVHFINSHEKWLIKALNSENTPPLIIADGSIIKVLGQPYHIVLADHSYLANDHIYLSSADLKVDLLAQTSEILIPYAMEKLHFYFDVMYNESVFPKIKFKHLRSKYGYYSRQKHQIVLSLSLALLAEELVEYVIVHELCHLKEYNHQKGFYAQMVKYLPNYKTLQKRLKKEGRLL